MTKTLIALMPNPTDATSFYRGVGPLHALRRRVDFDLVVGCEINWATLKACDGVFLQRPSHDVHSTIVHMAQDSRKPVWVDYDDDLFSVPICNRTYTVYGNPKTQNIITDIVCKADVITVSTVGLMNTFREILGLMAAEQRANPRLRLNPAKVLLVPNAYDNELMANISTMPPPTNQRPMVLWRGSGTHDKDLMLHTEQLCRVVEKHLDWTYTFVGEPFWYTLEALDKVKGLKPNTVVCTGTLDPIQYLKFLEETRPALVIVPLEDSRFNQAKSNIAWIEATHCGAVAVAPNWPEWARPGVLNYERPADFESVLDGAITNSRNLPKLWDESRKFIMQNLLLSKVNNLRELVVRDMLEGR